MKYALCATVSISLTNLLISAFVDEPDILRIILIAIPLLATLAFFSERVRRIKALSGCFLCCSILLYLFQIIRLNSQYNLDRFSFSVLFFLALDVWLFFASLKASEIGEFGVRTAPTTGKELWDKAHSFLSVAELVTFAPLVSLFFFANGRLRFAIAAVLAILSILAEIIYSTLSERAADKIKSVQTNAELEQQLKLEEQGKMK